ncbi:CHRD domain-containing protein [Sunxiuqinia sp. A32]|uniref:CHRD domain-containing protein n=1 Tax=Sunxiuqinia sp. A32 TaxID=3461496 RepID=UPI0040452D73
MKKIYLIMIVMSLIGFSACDREEFQVDVQDEVSLKSAKMPVMTFKAHLTSDQEVPPVESMATGQAIFMLSKDGMTLHYKLIVANIEGVTASHIHVGPAGSSGGPVAWLYMPQQVGGSMNGILAMGEIMADDLIGSLAGQDLSALVDAMKAGNTYVNVHTTMYGGGEIRGQISAN